MLPRSSKTGQLKGIAYVSFLSTDSAANAKRELDGSVFQGRILHILSSEPKREALESNDFSLSKLPIKEQKGIKRKLAATSDTINWSSLYMSSDAVVNSIADRYKISKHELLDPTNSESAVKQAILEARVIEETKEFFTEHGINVLLFEGKNKRGFKNILVKNFRYGTTSTDLEAIFKQFGIVTSVLIPPAGTFAMVQMENEKDGERAFKALAYRRFNDNPLYLEKGPDDLIVSTLDKVKKNDISEFQTALDDTSNLENNITTLFIKNLNFATTTTALQNLFSPLSGFRSAIIKTKPDPHNPGKSLSMGFGFVEFNSSQTAQIALEAMQGYLLDGHSLQIKISTQETNPGELRRLKDLANEASKQGTKIIIKNLPFEATKSDVRKLFGTYGHLRTVRIPKNYNSRSRGFAFAEFLTPREAQNAMESLKNAHLLGRHLVLELSEKTGLDI